VPLDPSEPTVKVQKSATLCACVYEMKRTYSIQQITVPNNAPLEPTHTNQRMDVFIWKTDLASTQAQLLRSKPATSLMAATKVSLVVSLSTVPR
jgi:hypothetical protein